MPNSTDRADGTAGAVGSYRVVEAVGADGPTDAAFLPRHAITVRPADSPITEPLPKLGGRPTWLDTPTWPLGARSGAPMMFIGQVPIPGRHSRLAYLFMTDDDDGMAEGYLPEAGDTALLIQPGGRIPRFVKTVDRPTGPTLWRRGTTWSHKIHVELHIDLTPLDPAADLAMPSSYLGGRPMFWQPTAVEVSRPWRFFFQLGCGDDNYKSTSYTLNFGEGGTGYAFLSPDHLESRFYWDCI
jgi:hypothetical protein